MNTSSPAQVGYDAYRVASLYRGLQSGQASTFSSATQIASAAANLAAVLGSHASEEQKAQAIAEQAGLAVADYYTCGLASTVVGLLDRYLPGVTGTIRKFLAKEPVFNAVVGLFDTDRWKSEGNRMKKLIESGVQIPEALQGAMQLTRGRLKEELINYSVPLDFQGITPAGQWANNTFAVSRNEADLRPQDIWGYATFFEKFGNDWLGRFSEQERYSIAAKALELGLVREHHGTIDVQWTPEFDAAIQKLRTSSPPAA